MIFLMKNNGSFRVRPSLGLHQHTKKLLRWCANGSPTFIHWHLDVIPSSCSLSAGTAPLIIVSADVTASLINMNIRACVRFRQLLEHAPFLRRAVQTWAAARSPAPNTDGARGQLNSPSRQMPSITSVSPIRRQIASKDNCTSVGR